MGSARWHNSEYETQDGSFRFLFRKRRYGWVVIERTFDGVWESYDETITAIDSPEQYLDRLQDAMGPLRRR